MKKSTLDTIIMVIGGILIGIGINMQWNHNSVVVSKQTPSSIIVSRDMIIDIKKPQYLKSEEEQNRDLIDRYIKLYNEINTTPISDDIVREKYMSKLEQQYFDILSISEKPFPYNYVEIIHNKCNYLIPKFKLLIILISLYSVMINFSFIVNKMSSFLLFIIYNIMLPTMLAALYSVVTTIPMVSYLFMAILISVITSVTVGCLIYFTLKPFVSINK